MNLQRLSLLLLTQGCSKPVLIYTDGSHCDEFLKKKCEKTYGSEFISFTPSEYRMSPVPGALGIGLVRIAPNILSEKVTAILSPHPFLSQLRSDASSPFFHLSRCSSITFSPATLCRSSIVHLSLTNAATVYDHTTRRSQNQSAHIPNIGIFFNPSCRIWFCATIKITTVPRKNSTMGHYATQVKRNLTVVPNTFRNTISVNTLNMIYILKCLHNKNMPVPAFSVILL